MELIYDFRKNLSPARNQGQRPTCLAFASSAANEFKHNINDYLSAEFLYQKALAGKPGTKGLTASEVKKALQAEGQPNEGIFPYGTTASIKTLAADIAIYKAKSNIIDASPKALRKILSEGGVPIVGISITKSFYKPDPPFFLVKDEFDNHTGKHALLVVGMATLSNKEHFLVRNSWGTGWGDAGHAWLSSDYIKRNAFMGLQLTA